jgi:hypothetical protein
MTMASLTDMAVARVTGGDTHRDVQVVATLNDRGVERRGPIVRAPCRLGTLTLGDTISVEAPTQAVRNALPS